MDTKTMKLWCIWEGQDFVDSMAFADAMETLKKQQRRK